MAQSRKEWWRSDPWRLAVPTTMSAGEMDGSDPLHAAWDERIANPLVPRQAGAFSEGELIRLSKEIIYCLDDDGDPAFSHVAFLLDLATSELVLEPALEMVKPDREDLLRIIGLAVAYDVRVVPDTPDLAPELLSLEREVLASGFQLEAEQGEKKRYRLGRYANLDVDAVEVLGSLELAEVSTPTEFRVLLETARRELESRTEAERLLGSLRLAIKELSQLLEVEGRIEEDLQRCLTRHPVLFGPDYTRLTPKFRLGGDYEMDFALERPSGLVDLVEIEASTHPLFTQRGRPRAALIEAEQQVLDWLDWLERHGSLAREKLPTMQRPVGFVVIGRDGCLDQEGRRRLQQRNAILRGTCEVMTYDGLLRRAQSLLDLFEGTIARAGSDQEGAAP